MYDPSPLTITRRLLEQYWTYEGYLVLSLIITGALILVGLVGNILVLIVFSTQIRRKEGISTNLPLLLLSISDTCGLLFLALPTYIGDWLIGKADIFHGNQFDCHVAVFITYFVPIVSLYTIAIVIITRLLVVLFPFRARELCSRNRILIAWFSIILIAGVYAGVNSLHIK